MIKSLSEYADLLTDRLVLMGEYYSHHEILRRAANELIKGYADINDALEETCVRLNPEGFEIDPSAVHDAAKYLNDEKNNS